MNENIDLTKILKDCPKGTKLYSTIFGYVKFCYIDKSAEYPIILTSEGGGYCSVSADGRNYVDFDGECTLFPSKEQRDWSKFTAPWYKNEKFDPKTLRPFDRVLVFDNIDKVWSCDFYSHKINEQDCFNPEFPYICVGNTTDKIIPYNEDTKHLVVTSYKAPEYYRYWEE